MFEHQKILILGFARSGYEVAKLLRKRDNQVIINDGKPEEKHDSTKIQELKDLGVEFVFGSHPDNLLDNSFQYLIKNLFPLTYLKNYFGYIPFPCRSDCHLARQVYQELHLYFQTEQMQLCGSMCFLSASFLFFL